MKNFVEINRALVAKKRIVMILMAVALLALPTMAQEQEQWKSTSIMSGAGGYTVPITEVGSSSVGEMATTTGSAAKASSRPRRIDTAPGQDGGHQDPNSPIGDAWPLAIFAALFAAYIAIRKYNLNAKKGQQS